MANINEVINLSVQELVPCQGTYDWQVTGGSFTANSGNTGTTFSFIPTSVGTYIVSATCEFGGSCNTVKEITIAVTSGDCTGSIGTALSTSDPCPENNLYGRLIPTFFSATGDCDLTDAAIVVRSSISGGALVTDGTKPIELRPNGTGINAGGGVYINNQEISIFSPYSVGDVLTFEYSDNKCDACTAERSYTVQNRTCATDPCANVNCTGCCECDPNSGQCIDKNSNCASNDCDNCTCQANCTDTCASLGFQCGTHTICGTPTNCGSCPTGQSCNGNGQCVSDCTDTCASLGWSCGTVCGEDCGSCTGCCDCSNGNCVDRDSNCGAFEACDGCNCERFCTGGNVSVSAGGTCGITVNWSGYQGCDSYVVRIIRNGSTIASTSVALGVSSHTFPNISPNSGYRAMVDCCLGANCLNNCAEFTSEYTHACPTTYNCNSQSGQCTDPGDGSGQYASLGACNDVCNPTATYNCSAAGCTDPGDGSGQYSSFSTCQNACISFNCTSSGCTTVNNTSGQYSTLSSCQSACVSYDCLQNGNCVQIAGNGGFATLSACESNCEAPETFSCGPNDCFAVADGTGDYTDLTVCRANCRSWACNSSNGICTEGLGNSGFNTSADCLANCSAPASFNCGTTGCTDPGDGSGTYSTMSACQSACVTYNCGSSGCFSVNNTTGQYSTLSTCQSACKSWECDGNGNCSEIAGNGGFATLSACENDCVIPETYNCGSSDCFAVSDGTGTYTNLTVCRANCTSWFCNTGTLDCTEEVGTGGYASLADCNAGCAPANTYNCTATGCINPGDGSGQYNSLNACQSACTSYNCVAEECVLVNNTNGQYNTLSECRGVTFNTNTSVPSNNIFISCGGGTEIKLNIDYLTGHATDCNCCKNVTYRHNFRHYKQGTTAPTYNNIITRCQFGLLSHERTLDCADYEIGDVVIFEWTYDQLDNPDNCVLSNSLPSGSFTETYTITAQDKSCCN